VSPGFVGCQVLGKPGHRMGARFLSQRATKAPALRENRHDHHL
jgi:hypothetical protein